MIKQKLSDREFFSLIEKQISDCEPSSDRCVQDGLSPEFAAGLLAMEQIYVDADPKRGFNAIIDNSNYRL